jgi:hypothetical protein
MSNKIKELPKKCIKCKRFPERYKHEANGRCTYCFMMEEHELDASMNNQHYRREVYL